MPSLFFPDGLHSIWQRLVNLHQNSKPSDLRLPASAYLSDQTYLANLGGHKEADQLTSTKDATTHTECGDQFFLGDLDVVKAFEALKRDHTSLSPLMGCYYLLMPHSWRHHRPDDSKWQDNQRWMETATRHSISHFGCV